MPYFRLLASPLAWLGAIFVGVLAISCTPSIAPTVSIPTQPSPPPGQVELCANALRTPFTLAGDSSKNPAVWGIDSSGDAFAITWPAGFRARFSPSLEILDPSGNVVERGGVVISDAGGGSGPGGEGFDICSIGGKTY